MFSEVSATSKELNGSQVILIGSSFVGCVSPHDSENSGKFRRVFLVVFKDQWCLWLAGANGEALFARPVALGSSVSEPKDLTRTNPAAQASMLL